MLAEPWKSRCSWVSLTLPLLLAAPSKAAEPEDGLADTAECARNYERAQEERAVGRLQTALGHLDSCRNEGCPEFVRVDCERWMAEVESELPSILVLVRMPGGVEPDGVLRVDGAVMGRGAPGEAISLDPGMHRLAWEPPGKPAVERQVVVQQGVKNRTIEFDFRPRPPPARSRESVADRSSRPWRPWAFASLGVGAVGLGIFGTVGWIARTDNSALEADCPQESPDSVGPGICLTTHVADRQGSIGDKNLAADIGLGMGVVGIVTGVVLLVTSSPASAETDRESTAPLGWALDLQKDRAGATFSGQF